MSGQSILRLSVVVPVHNEEQLLVAVITSIESALNELGSSYELVLVENGSRDRSPQLADDLARRLAHVRVLHQPVADYGRALREGIVQSRGEIVANFSVDFVDIAFLRKALVDMDMCDIVTASKHVKRAEDRRTFIRRLGGLAFHLLARWLLDLTALDTHGIKVMRRSSVHPIVLRCRHGGALFDTELLARAERSGLRVCEVPATVWDVRPSRRGVTALAIRSVVGLVQLRFELRRSSGAARRHEEPIRRARN